MVEWPARGMALRLDTETNARELHFGKRLVSVTSLERCSEAHEVSRLHLREIRSNDTAERWWHSSTMTCP